MFDFALTHLLRTQWFLFITNWKFFLCFGVKKKTEKLQGGNNYFIVLLANENVECNQLENKTNTIKRCCEKSKSPAAISCYRKYPAIIVIKNGNIV